MFNLPVYCYWYLLLSLLYYNSCSASISLYFFYIKIIKVKKNHYVVCEIICDENI